MNLVRAVQAMTVMIGIGIATGTYFMTSHPVLRVVVRVDNVGDEPLRSLAITSREESYSLGDLAPGESACVPIDADCETSVALSFTSSTGAITETIIGYLQPHQRGSVSADLTIRGIAAVEAKVF